MTTANNTRQSELARGLTSCRMAGGIAAAVLAAAGSASAQTSRLYMMDAQFPNTFNTQVRVAQGGQVTQTLNVNSVYEHNIVVVGDIRTYGDLYSGQPGYKYDLNGVYQNVQYLLNGDRYGEDIFYGADAATDGKNYNWVHDIGFGYVMRFDRDWKNATPAFGISESGGITCDPTGNGGSGSLWLLEDNLAIIRQVDYNGNTISQFFDAALWGVGGWRSLARDPADGTLWVIQGNAAGDGWRQYDTQGNLKSTGQFGHGNFTGSAEFDMNSRPADPADLAIVEPMKGLANLTWTDIAKNETGYRVRREQYVQGAWKNGTIVGILPADAASFSQALGQGLWRYQVQAFNANGDSAWTGLVPALPAAPGGVSVTKPGGSAKVSWTDRSNFEANFLLQRQQKVSNVWTSLTKVATLPKNATTYTDSPGPGTWRYRLRANNNNNNNNAGSSVFTPWVAVKLP